MSGTISNEAALETLVGVDARWGRSTGTLVGRSVAVYHERQEPLGTPEIAASPLAH
jgi:hypothetical protein